jgi:hypothetical protein
MANQYSKITQWIKHHKDHGDLEYEEAILYLCLDIYLNIDEYGNGLTFLYQTNKTIRKQFCDRIFTPSARDACNEFKRHILNDVFHSCEDFLQKDIENLLGEKYIVKSCTKDTVTFVNGMEIKAIEHSGGNSYEPLDIKLIDKVKIYYVIKGDPKCER